MKTAGDARSVLDGPVGAEGAAARSRNRRVPAGARGFTLIELLVVIAIIGILAAVAVPQFGGYRRKGFDADVQANVRNLALAQEAYFLDNNTYADTLADLTDFGYVRSANVTPAITKGDATTFVVKATVASGCKSGTGVATYDRAVGQVALVKCGP